jgi:hypothetical protein
MRYQLTLGGTVVGEFLGALATLRRGGEILSRRRGEESLCGTIAQPIDTETLAQAISRLVTSRASRERVR